MIESDIHTERENETEVVRNETQTNRERESLIRLDKISTYVNERSISI
jgi:hypothetical protein